jgi:hypothetical protein
LAAYFFVHIESGYLPHDFQNLPFIAAFQKEVSKIGWIIGGVAEGIFALTVHALKSIFHYS